MLNSCKHLSDALQQKTDLCPFLWRTSSSALTSHTVPTAQLCLELSDTPMPWPLVPKPLGTDSKQLWHFWSKRYLLLASCSFDRCLALCCGTGKLSKSFCGFCFYNKVKNIGNTKHASCMLFQQKFFQLKFYNYYLFWGRTIPS